LTIDFDSEGNKKIQNQSFRLKLETPYISTLLLARRLAIAGHHITPSRMTSLG
jgi:hypothetical protein